MAVIVSFATPRGIGSAHAPGIGPVRAMEVLELGGTDATTEAALAGEVAVITNGESDPILAAFGHAPDATATEAVANATTAGVGIAAGFVAVLVLGAGDKVAVAALPGGD